MNLHVIILHFPIALLTLYGVLEAVPLRRLREWQPGFYLKAVLAILGAASAHATILSGELIAGSFRDAGRLLEWHEDFASLTTWTATAIAALYLIAWLGRDWNYQPRLGAAAAKILQNRFMPLLGLLVLLSITLTGVFGGAIAFGPDADPFAKPILRLFGITT